MIKIENDIFKFWLFYLYQLLIIHLISLLGTLQAIKKHKYDCTKLKIHK